MSDEENKEKKEAVEVQKEAPKKRAKKKKLDDRAVAIAKYARDKDGLLENVSYEFKENGLIDWRSMIGLEHLYVNKDWYETRNRELPESIQGLKDYQLLIKLSGIKELAQLRGYTSVSPHIIESSNERVVAQCHIDWIGNYETGGVLTYYGDVGNATIENTSGFGHKFLETIAANRAFVRSVRNFLKIHIVGADEMDSSSKEKKEPQETVPKLTGPLASLQKKLQLDNNDDGWQSFIEILRGLWKNGSYKNESIKDWKKWDDVPVKEIIIVYKLLNK